MLASIEWINRGASYVVTLPVKKKAAKRIGTKKTRPKR
jgi:hypothetical protein